MADPDTQRLLFPFEHLIAELGANGFAIGVGHRLRLMALLDRIAGDTAPESLQTLICPIFATNAEQQDTFYRVFRTCYPAFYPKVDRPLPPSPPPHPLPKSIQHRMLWSGLCLLVFAIVGGYLFLRPQYEGHFLAKAYEDALHPESIITIIVPRPSLPGKLHRFTPKSAIDFPDMSTPADISAQYNTLNIVCALGKFAYDTTISVDTLAPELVRDDFVFVSKGQVDTIISYWTQGVEANRINLMPSLDTIVRRLVYMLRSPDEATREQAAESLTRLWNMTPAAAPLKDSDSSGRSQLNTSMVEVTRYVMNAEMSGRAVGNPPTPSTVWWLGIIGSSWHRVQGSESGASAGDSTRSIGLAEIVERLITILRGNQRLRPHAAGALGLIGPEGRLAVPLLQNVAKTDTDQQTRRAATWALERIGPVDSIVVVVPGPPFLNWVLRILSFLFLTAILYWLGRLLGRLGSGRSPDYTALLQSLDRPLAYSIKLRDADKALRFTADLYRASRVMRQRTMGDYQRLDISKTISATVQAGGYPVVSYKTDSRIPEYLVLIDRITQRDHQAEYFSALVSRLQDEGVELNVYYYNGDPRYCRLRGQNQKTIHIDDLNVLFPDTRLLIFGDGKTFLYPQTGTAQSWAEWFAGWKFRALFTPADIHAWGKTEATLNSRFDVMPARSTAFALLGDRFDSELTHDLEEWIQTSYTSPGDRETAMQYRNALLSGSEDPAGSRTFAELPYWLRMDRGVPDTMTGDEPPEEIVHRLHWYLGPETFQWLCALSLHYELHWDLTLAIGSLKCMGPDVVTEKNLLRLIRLPWFRQGKIPDKIRMALTPELELGREKPVRALIIQAIENNLAPENSVARRAQELQLGLQKWQLEQTPQAFKNFQRLISGYAPGELAGDRTIKPLLEQTSRKHPGNGGLITILGFILGAALLTGIGAVIYIIPPKFTERKSYQPGSLTTTIRLLPVLPAHGVLDTKDRIRKDSIRNASLIQAGLQARLDSISRVNQHMQDSINTYRKIQRALDQAGKDSNLRAQKHIQDSITAFRKQQDSISAVQDRARRDSIANHVKDSINRANAPLSVGQSLDFPGIIYNHSEPLSLMKDPSSVKGLQRLLNMLRNNPGMSVEIQGYAERNVPVKLSGMDSQNSAEIVMKWLVDNGISQSRLTARGMGFGKGMQGITILRTY